VTLDDQHTPYSERSDEALARACQSGDSNAFEEIVYRYQHLMYRIAFRMTSHQEDAMDATQDALVKAWQNIRKWKPTHSFRSWLLRLASNQAVDQVRKSNRKRQKEVSVDSWTPEMEGAGAERASHTTPDTAQFEQRLNVALQQVSETQRKVFVMRHFEQMALKEIGEVLECTTGTVKVHLHRAIKKLRKEIGPETQDWR
jgi:RNA polymerase sigma-70 factor (ECF subfamily)